MTLASKKYLHPEAIRRIARLEIRARHIVEGFLSGMHNSPYFGQSVEFHQHREYTPGDDLRRVDWKVWAKQDRLYIKQFEEETNLRCTLVVDASRSMAYQGGPLSKFDYAATVATSLAYLVLKQQDAIGACVFAEQIRTKLPFRSSRVQLNSLVAALQETSPADATDIFPVFREIAETYPRRGLMIVISDLLGDVDGMLKGIRLLRRREHDVLVLHVLADDELDFPFSGPSRFEALEGDARLNCNPRALREGYLEAVGKFLADVRHGCARSAVDYRLIRTSEHLDAALAHFLSHRLGRFRTT